MAMPEHVRPFSLNYGKSDFKTGFIAITIRQIIIYISNNIPRFSKKITHHLFLLVSFSTLLASSFLVISCTRYFPRDANDDQANWPSFGRTAGAQNYSPLASIDKTNVSRLGLAWSYDLQPGNSVSAPVEVDGVIYTATGYSIVTALDAVTGKKLWRFDPHVPEAAGKKLAYAWGIRGLSYDHGRVFVGTQDGRLIALDAADGGVRWSVLTTEPGDNRYITGPPRTFAGKLIIGHGGADVGGVRGYVTCIDQKTGKQLWRFYTVPGDPAKGFENEAMAMAAKTWSGEWWKYGAGGTVWNAIAYDSETNLVLIGVGNGFPWDHKIRSLGEGDNLFLASIVALDGNTGAYKWHYQVNPGESWDYTATQDIELADLVIGGRVRKVLLHAPKNGFFYVIDRTNGKLISAEPFAKVTWATRIDTKTGRPVENPDARYRNDKVFDLWPGPTGAHNWLPMAYSPQTQLVYLPASDRPISISNAVRDYGISRPGGAKSRLIAWNPVTQKPEWTVETPGIWSGGAIVTAGNVVFQGQINDRFNAYDARTGRRLWSFDTRAPAVAPPITFSVRGTQYVTVLTGYGGSVGMFPTNDPDLMPDYRTMARRVLTFAIGGKAMLPLKQAPDRSVPHDPSFVPDKARETRGSSNFDMRCSLCHGLNVVAGGAAPDLRYSQIPANRDAFHAVVRDGTLVSHGMPRFDDGFTEEQTEDIRAYLRSRARDASQHKEN